ncbi:MAG: ABC transporter permease [Anaerolineaceae bacterium]|nr:ABC transporter permease [Anaerolineaceae bacterium]
MLGFKLERGSAPIWLRGLIPILAVVLTFLLVSIIIIFAGANPLEAVNQLLINPLTKTTARWDIIVMATPLLLTGVAVAFAFASGYYNIGAEGQLYAGAIAGAWLGPQLQSQPPLVAIAIMLIGGFIAGAMWALPPALLKVRLGVDEVVTTLLLNSVMLFIVSALLNGPWRDPTTGWPQSPTIADSAQFPILVPRSRIHLGFIVAVMAIIGLWWIFQRTRFGLELRAAGMGKDAARFMGVRVNRVMLTAALVSGGVAGLAGVGEIAGIHHHLVEAISPGYGYTGIIVATLGGLTAPGVGLAGLFIALIERGSLSANRELNVPVYLGDVIQAVLLITTLALLLLNRYRLRRVR